jgi:hypothetical protein
VLLPDMEVELSEPEGSVMTVTLWPLPETGHTPEFSRWLYSRRLTWALMERQAHEDAGHLRTWFAVAALAPDVPAKEVLAHLQTVIKALPETPDAAKVGRTFIREMTAEHRTLHCRVDHTCPVRVVVRALSRLWDVSESELLGLDAEGNLIFTTVLGPDVDRTWWEQMFAALLVRCADEGLPALYPPAHPVAESIRPLAEAPGVQP